MGNEKNTKRTNKREKASQLPNTASLGPEQRMGNHEKVNFALYQI